VPSIRTWPPSLLKIQRGLQNDALKEVLFANYQELGLRNFHPAPRLLPGGVTSCVESPSSVQASPVSFSLEA